MKVIKKVLIAILVFILIDIIFLLAISFNIKNILVNGVIKETIVQRIVPRNYNVENNIITEEQIKEITDDPRVQEMLNSPEMQGLLEEYLDTTVEELIDTDNIDEVALEQDMLNFIKDNRQVIEEKVGKEITDEMIDNAYDQLEGKDLSKAYKQALENASKNMTKTEKEVLKGYKFLISMKFKIILFIAMIIDLLLIALLQWSVYKWIKTFAKSLIASGVGIVIASIVSKAIVMKTANLSKFDTSSLTTTGIIITAAGFIILIIYLIVLKLVKKKDDQDEISTVSKEK